VLDDESNDTDLEPLGASSATRLLRLLRRHP
jgi:hypothetical protein